MSLTESAAPPLATLGQYVPASHYTLTSDSTPRLIPTKLRPHGVLILGEAPGREEDVAAEPFIGASGRFLRRFIRHESLFADCCITFANVFPWRPPENKLSEFTIRANKTNIIAIRNHWPSALGLLSGRVPHPQVSEQASTNLLMTLEIVAPNIILALGATATWALLGKTGIGSLRGALYYTALPFPPVKVLPTYHPAYIMQYYANAMPFFADLMKADMERTWDKIVFPNRTLLLRPTLEEVAVNLASMHAAATKDDPVSFDIETAKGHITMVSLAPNPFFSMVIPLYDLGADGKSYWTTHEERHIINLLRKFLETTPITGHYFQYDLDWVFAHWGAKPMLVHDTTISAHALWPSMRKSLGFLCSFLTDEPRAWKRLRAIKVTDRKRED